MGFARGLFSKAFTIHRGPGHKQIKKDKTKNGTRGDTQGQERNGSTLDGRTTGPFGKPTQDH